MRFLLSPALAFLVLAMLSGGCSDSKQPLAVAVAAPLSFSPEFADLGSITFGERASTIYTLKNTSDLPLVVSRIGPFACQCVIADLVLPSRSGDLRKRRLDGKRLNLELQPNEVAEIHFVLDTSRYRKPASRKVGSIPVVFRDHPGITLQWGADIYTPFIVEPWAIEMGAVGIRSQPTGRALVTGHDVWQFDLDVDFEQEGWKVKSRPILVEGTTKSTYEITFTAPEYLPEGPFLEQFRMLSNLPDAPPIKINVQGLAQADLSFSPTRLLFDPDRGRNTQRLIFAQRAVGLDLSDLVFADFANHDLKYTAGPAQDFPQQKAVTQALELEFLGEPPTTSQSGVIKIPTGDEMTPVLEIPYTVLPKRADS
ncbi:MAG: DUF1573 domain-containing protein [Planctomycetes bacterium]|nr:DUF1573 domain-containing protein [Planctomycetota bacterium]MCP4771602.1 DUF1573 domain-containing protein [Planctomycetota bacterium]MCP4860098.1 DUF1573 domain-containing protein [Planctomycetota bacterium]